MIKYSQNKKPTFLKRSFIALCSCICAIKPISSFAEEAMNSNPDPVVVTTDIHGTVDQVWQALIDFDNYAKWNKWYRVEGAAELGSTVKAIGDVTLDLKITKIDDNELCWVDVTWFTHLGMGGWRCRGVVPNSDGKTVKLSNHFEYTGPLSFVLEVATKKALIKGMEMENQNLKDFVESANTGH